jgi:hypothetical protein
MKQIHIRLERCSETRYRVIHGGREIGVWRDPEHSAVRFLIDNGLAERGDMLRTFRGDALCMTGDVGWFAGRVTSEPDHDGPRTVKWKPFPALRRPPGRPSDEGPVSFPSETLEAASAETVAG